MDKNVLGLMDFFNEENCLKLYDNMTVVFPRFSQERVLNLSALVPKYNGCFAINNGIVCFIYNTEAYVTPLTPTVITILTNSGFIKKSFCVPFSSREYPKHEQSIWKTILQNAARFNKKTITA